jgi:hypothetical protein
MVASSARNARAYVIPLTLMIGQFSHMGNVMAVAKDDGDELTRAAWRYNQQDLIVTIKQAHGKEWIAERSDGKKPAYEEVSRTDDYIELQNRDTKLLIRLYTDQAQWKRPKDSEWTPWVRGSWVSAAPTLDVKPRNEVHKVQLAYFVPRDRRPVRRFDQKIRTVMTIVSTLYREDLRAKGYEFDGISFEGKNNEPVVRLVRGEREAAYYNNAPAYEANEQWRRLNPEIRSKVGDPQRTLIVAFVETYDNGPAEHLWPGAIARGAYFGPDGGLAIYSSHLLRDEFCAATIDAQRRLFFDQTPVQGRKAWGHRMNSPLGEFVEDGIGAVAHELGHAFGLPHDRRQDNLDIMGNGFRNLRWNFAPSSKERVGFSEENAWLLMSSRYIANDLDLTDNQPPRVELGKISMGSGRLTVSVKATDNNGLRAIVFLDRNAGTIVGGRKLHGTKDEFRQVLSASAPKGRETKLQAIVTDDGGNQTRTTP